MPPQNRPPLRCMFCRKMFGRKHAQGLFCSPAHAQAYRDREERNAMVLATAGFEAEGNKYTKDGHTLTLDEVRHHGLVKALAQHAAATE